MNFSKTIKIECLHISLRDERNSPFIFHNRKRAIVVLVSHIYLYCKSSFRLPMTRKGPLARLGKKLTYLSRRTNSRRDTQRMRQEEHKAGQIKMSEHERTFLTIQRVNEGVAENVE